MSFYQEIHRLCNGLDVSLLINNVGIMPFGNFCQTPCEQETGVIDVNVMPFVMLSRLFLPQFLERKAQKGKMSGIVNVSSAFQKGYLRMCITYCASKAFMAYLSGGMAFQLRGRVDVLDHAPSATASNLIPEAKPWARFLTTAQDCAKQGLNALGQAEFTAGGIFHDFQYRFCCFLNEFYLGLGSSVLTPVF